MMSSGIATTSTAKVVSGCGSGLSLLASMSGVSGVSGAFAVTCPGTQDAAAEGRVVDGGGAPINGATVRLLGGSGSLPETQTAGGGRYRLAPFPPGTYTITASFGGNAASRNGVVFPAGKPQTVDLTISTGCEPGGPNPVMLVPGIMGSTIDPDSVFPVLPAGPIAWDSTLWPVWPSGIFKGFKNPGGLLDRVFVKVGWQSLVADLEKLKEPGGSSFGYRVGCNIFSVPYDWRLRPDKVQPDLLHAIDEAKRRTGKGKVDIVAHSMGGLVARAYIQSDDYLSRDDVDHLVMVGTPNHGSPIAYYLWEGGSAASTVGSRRKLSWSSRVRRRGSVSTRATRGLSMEA
jgi:pimeloyl-ACP methyl ester carboxylesterase